MENIGLLVAFGEKQPIYRDFSGQNCWLSGIFINNLLNIENVQEKIF